MRHLWICSLLLPVILNMSSAERRRIRKKLRNDKVQAWSIPEEDMVEDEDASTNVGSPRRTSAEDSSYRFLNPFSLFSIVQFPNTECTTASSSQGTCYTGSQCTSRGGTADGSCASGFGVCCTFSNECNTETSQNGTYFNSPDTLSLVCSLMISPMNDNICQVRTLHQVSLKIISFKQIQFLLMFL